MNRRILFPLAAWTLLAVLLVAACAAPPPPCPLLESGEVELEFETLTRDGLLGRDNLSREERLIVMNNAEDFSIPYPDSISSKHLQNQIDAVDFERYFVVGLFYGIASSSGYDVNIKRITQKDGELRICAEFWRPGKNQGTLPLETYPYHFVKVTRDPHIERYDTIVLQKLTVRGPFPYWPKPD